MFSVLDVGEGDQRPLLRCEVHSPVLCLHNPASGIHHRSALSHKVLHLEDAFLATLGGM